MYSTILLFFTLFKYCNNDLLKIGCIKQKYMRMNGRACIFAHMVDVGCGKLMLLVHY
jgi:hypothetical protein